MANENPHRQPPDRQDKNTDTRHNHEPCGETEQALKERAASRLREAGIPTKRFIDVKDGRKQSYDHTKREPSSVTGNYGVMSGGGLVGLDIDDYGDGVDTSALESLPSTFTVSTPHGGTHRYYKGAQGVATTVKSATGGSNNASLSWGEVYVGGKYLVGPGSRIVDCDKPHCTECARHAGTYSISNNRPIAEISSEEVLCVLGAASEGGNGGAQSPLTLFTNRETDPSTEDRTYSPDLSTPSRKIREIEDPARMLWESLRRHHEHNDVETGVEVRRVLDRAEEFGLERWWAADRLMDWIETGRLKKTDAPNRVAPSWAEPHRHGKKMEGEQTGIDSFR